ncbi:MAG: exodeoxyribonuclease VII small subunit [Oscillospiraceae bacterium]
MKLFERGTELAGECRKTLETAKQKIIPDRGGGRK